MQLYIAGNTMPPTIDTATSWNVNGFSFPYEITAERNAPITRIQRKSVTVEIGRACTPLALSQKSHISCMTTVVTSPQWKFAGTFSPAVCSNS